MNEQDLIQLKKSIEDREMKKIYELTTNIQKKGTGRHTDAFMGVGARVLKIKKSKGCQSYKSFTLAEYINGKVVKKAEPMLTHFNVKNKSVQSRQLVGIHPATKPKQIPMNLYVTTNNKRKRS